MALTYILFVVGFVLLVKGAGFLVDGASSLAKHVGVSPLVIGLTVVSLGTSAPELVVNILASISGNTDIAIGNILGSNIANILLVLGVSAIIYPLAANKGTVWKEIPFAFFAIILLALMVNDVWIDNSPFSAITRNDGFILITFFAIFSYYIFGISKIKGTSKVTSTPHSYSLWQSHCMILGGLVGLGLGGKWIVDGAVVIATSLGISEALIGLTIVALGTSLPELATSAVAAYKKNIDIALGNIVGSNILNVFLVLGISAIIHPLPFPSALAIDVFITAFATLLLFLFLFIDKHHTLGRREGICFVILYICYIVFLIVRA